MRHLCDANVFVAVAVQLHAHHREAAAWFNGLGDADTAAFCRAVQTSFLRLLTQKIAANYSPVTNEMAWNAYERLCRDFAVVFAEEPEHLERTWRKLAAPASVSPKVWMDAYLAAFAMEGGWRLVTFDRDFKIYETQGLNLLLLGPRPAS